MAKEEPKKKCKGTGKAKGHGCLTMQPLTYYGKRNHHYGLAKSCKCYTKWLLETDEGKEVLAARTIQGQKRARKAAKSKAHRERADSLHKNWSKLLQVEINKIVRHIDKGLPCLARIITGQMHAGHVYARGGHSTIKYNLHNIHRQSAQSNHFGNDDGKLREGVIREYGQHYMDFISELRQTPMLHYNNKEYRELTKKARNIYNELKKNPRAYTKTERIEMRNRINIQLGIYEQKFCEFEM